MFEKQLSFSSKDELKVAEERPLEKKKVLIGRMAPHPGHTVFELNQKTGAIKIAEFKSTVAVYDKNSKSYGTSKRIDLKEDCLYTSALNIKNAKKHFIKMLTKHSNP